MPSGWAAAATREEGGGGGLCIALHEGKGEVWQVEGIGNWDWAAAAGRAQLVAGSFELQKEPFF